jgi:Transposase DDE domain
MRTPPISNGLIARVVGSMLGNELHDKQIESIAHGTIGALFADRAGVAAIGRAAARRRGKSGKYGIKQFDRYLSNDKISFGIVFEEWVPRIVGARQEIVVALDWTEHALDGHSTIAISMVTRHGRATPLVWHTVETSKLKDRRASYEDGALMRLANALPASVRVTVLADRGFGDTELYEFLDKGIRFDFVIRFRGCIKVTSVDGDCRAAHAWVPVSGKPRRLLNARLTGRRRPVAAVVVAHDRGMKEPWCLATSRKDTAQRIVALYSRRFQIEENFRDTKDRRFGLGLYDTRIGAVGRRDRMLLVIAIAVVIATLLGAAGEELGLDRLLRANTAKKRTHSLFRQGREYIAGVAANVGVALRNLFISRWAEHAKTSEIYASI